MILLCILPHLSNIVLLGTKHRLNKVSSYTFEIFVWRKKRIPTGISIKKKPSISLWSEVFITDWENVLFRAKQELLKLWLHQNQGSISFKFDEIEEFLKEHREQQKVI